MRIDDISPRRKGLCAVTADGEEYLLNSETVEMHRLKKGQQIEPQFLSSLKKESDLDRAKSRALWYISRGDHSKKALFDKLRRAFPPEAAEAAVERMCELGLIDDRRYAEQLAKSMSDGNRSKREILRKLFEKGIPNEVAKEAVDALECDAVAQITELIEKKYVRRLDSEEGVQKVFAALVRRGFSFGDVKSALRQYSENIENSEEW